MACMTLSPRKAENVIIGTVRDSMKDNPLLQRVELEKSLSHGHYLPNPQFCYGRPSNRNGGVADTLNNWNTGVIGCLPPHKKDKDFVSMNRAAVCIGLSKSEDQSRFRCCHPMTVVPPKAKKGVPLKVEIPEIAHGVRMRPGTPVSDVLSNKFGRDFIQDNWMKEYKKRSICEKKSPTVIGKIIHTRASEMMSYHPPAQIEPEIKISPKYAQIPSQLDTFGSDKLRKHSKTREAERKLEEEKEKMRRQVQQHIDALTQELPVKLRSKIIQNPNRSAKVYGPYYYNPSTGEKRGDPTLRPQPPVKPMFAQPWKVSPVYERALNEL